MRRTNAVPETVTLPTASITLVHGLNTQMATRASCEKAIPAMTTSV